MPQRKLRPDEIPAVVVFRENVQALRHASARRQGGPPVTLKTIAREAQISTRNLMYQLEKDREDGGHAPTLRTISAVAKVFGLQAWQLLLPGLNPELLLNPDISERLDKIVQRYQRTTEATRTGIDLLAPHWPEPPED